jgi:5-formyltetrahydrofolate cyclo-ligase
VSGDPTIKRALAQGVPVTVEELGHVDLVICGTVNRDGVRVGKGGGYSALELGLLVQAGLVDDARMIATTVHSLQLLDEELRETAHDSAWTSWPRRMRSSAHVPRAGRQA